MPQLPSTSPFIAANLMCPTCAEIIEPVPVKNAKGGVRHLEYRHQNPNFGCSYIVESNAMVTAEAKPLRVTKVEMVA